MIVEGDDEDNDDDNGKNGGSTTANAKRGAAVASGGGDEEKPPSEGSMQKKKRGRPPGSKNKTSVKTPRKQRKSKAGGGGGGGEEDESFITLTQTLRRNSEKAKQQELERREAKEERKRKRQAPRAAVVEGTSDSPERFDTAAHRGRAADVFRGWMASSVGDVMQPLQVRMLKAYLAQLIDEKDLEDVFNILTAFRRRACSEELKSAYNDVHGAVQEKMEAEYGAPLRLALPFPLRSSRETTTSCPTLY